MGPEMKEWRPTPQENGTELELPKGKCAVLRHVMCATKMTMRLGIPISLRSSRKFDA